MYELKKIHEGKTPQRIHFIAEWAEKRGLKQSDVAREIGADKGLVSRWFSGTVPKAEYLEQLRALFHAEEVSSLFRHPDDDWIARLFRDKSDEQRERAIDMLRLLFQDSKTGTDG
jgi:transcriptional regulator with XRE-family HTH domain